ncbi:cobalamin-dependent protein, partial [Bartonella apis]
EAAEMAIENKVQLIGVSSLAAGHKTLLPQLVKALQNRNSKIIVVCGGVVPRQDYEFLKENGVAAVFGPGTNVVEAASRILDLLQGKLRNI